MHGRWEARPTGGAFFMGLLVLVGVGILCVSAPQMAAAQDNGEMTVEEAYRLGEEFGLIVEELDEEISKELHWEWQGAEGVVVMGIIGSTPAEVSGLEPRKVLLQIDGMSIRTLLDFGRAMKKARGTCGFTVMTYEPATAENQGIGAGVNANSVLCPRD